MLRTGKPAKLHHGQAFGDKTVADVVNYPDPGARRQRGQDA